MGKIPIITREQKIILDGVAESNFFRDNFYFTGGTALSAFYLQHRYSEDLDFFSEGKFDSQIIDTLMNDLSKKHHFSFKSETIESLNKFLLTFSNGSLLKVDFNYYPFPRVEKSVLKEGIYVDSLLDIAINKLHTIVQRQNIKDFVDFYYLEPKFGIWDLMIGVKVKFHQEQEPYLLASDLLKIEDFDTLPRMIKPLTLKELQVFFRKIAIELGKKAVE